MAGMEQFYVDAGDDDADDEKNSLLDNPSRTVTLKEREASCKIYCLFFADLSSSFLFCSYLQNYISFVV